MQRLFLFLVSLLMIAISNAQVKKGNFIAEGNIGSISMGKNDTKYLSESFSNTSEGKDFAISFYPKVGYCFSKKIIAGAALDFSFNNNRYTGFDDNERKVSSSKYKNSTLGISPFIRYYFAESKNRLSAFYAQISGGLNVDVSNSNEYTYYDGPTGNITSTAHYNYIKNYPSVIANGGIGINRFLYESIALNGMIGYQYFRNKEKTTYDSTPAGGTTTSSPESTYTYTSKSIIWSIGISAFFPSCRKKNK